MTRQLTLRLYLTWDRNMDVKTYQEVTVEVPDDYAVYMVTIPNSKRDHT